MSDPLRPQQAPPSGGFPWRGVLIGCGILAILAVLMTCVGGAVLYRVVQPPDDVSAAVSAPAESTVGQEVDVVVTVDNRRGTSVQVGDVDLADAYIGGFTVVSTDPEPRSRRGYDLLGIQSFTFDTGIPAGSARTFTFRLRAVRAGMFRGDVDINVGMGMITQVAETVVREQAP